MVATSLTSAAGPAPVLPSVSGFQVPAPASGAPAEFLPDAPLLVQKLPPGTADASPARSQNILNGLLDRKALEPRC